MWSVWPIILIDFNGEIIVLCESSYPNVLAFMIHFDARASLVVSTHWVEENLVDRQ